ncbi:MAG: hypothetical protein RIM72_16070 [Alphaproteobacteria bacterium]
MSKTHKASVGYVDSLSVCAGETVSLMVSSEDGSNEADITLVRLYCTDSNPQGVGFDARAVDIPENGRYAVEHQTIQIGSYIEISPKACMCGIESFTILANIWPTLKKTTKQVIFSQWSTRSDGFSVFVSPDGCLGFEWSSEVVGCQEVVLDQPMHIRKWYRISVVYDAKNKTLTLHQAPVEPEFEVEDFCVRQSVLIEAPCVQNGVNLLIAAKRAAYSVESHAVESCYNGKIENIRFLRIPASRQKIERWERADLECHEWEEAVAAWDFALHSSTDDIHDRSPNALHGKAVNQPTRAMKGSNWTGEEFRAANAPMQYSAIHFHEDDLLDARWKTTCKVTLPEGIPSGVYAFKVVTQTGKDHIPFYIRASIDNPTSDVLYLAPTATYLAYGNFHELGEGLMPSSVAATGELYLNNEDKFLIEHPEFGLSLYDRHLDGSGCFYSSRLRPLLNMRPDCPIWGFNGDGFIVDFLDRNGIACDVATDEDLDLYGLDVLRNYRVVVTGCHPEYFSSNCWRALYAYTNQGGRLMYLGGNGFYKRVAYKPGDRTAIELRRTEDGPRQWEVDPGEYFMSYDGSYGGLWRRAGFPPQKLVGVGFCAQGFDSGTYYRKSPEANSSRYSFVFDGVTGETFGAFGLAGGAAGQEIDRMDFGLGTPLNAVILASSEGHSDNMLPGKEEILIVRKDMGADKNPKLRSDIVIFPKAGGGAVFSVGSISWAAALPWSGGNNEIARITMNVLEKFRSEAEI